MGDRDRDLSIAECRFEPDVEEPPIASLKAEPLGKYVVAGLDALKGSRPKKQTLVL